MTNLNDYLVEQHILDAELLATYFEQSERNNQRLLCYLAENKMINTDVLIHAVKTFFQLPVVDLSNYEVNDIPLDVVFDELLQPINALPLRKNKTYLDLAIVDPR